MSDLISRSAAIAAVEAKADRCDQCVCILLTEAHDALAALPADRRWDELRAWIVARQAKAESYRQWNDLWSMFDLVLDQMDRLAPPAGGADEP